MNIKCRRLSNLTVKGFFQLFSSLTAAVAGIPIQIQQIDYSDRRSI